jgi:hypothetical protein
VTALKWAGYTLLALALAYLVVGAIVRFVDAVAALP